MGPVQLVMGIPNGTRWASTRVRQVYAVANETHQPSGGWRGWVGEEGGVGVGTHCAYGDENGPEYAGFGDVGYRKCRKTRGSICRNCINW